MLKWMPWTIYSHLNLKAWEICSPASMTHPLTKIAWRSVHSSLGKLLETVCLWDSSLCVCLTIIKADTVDTVFCYFLFLFFLCLFLLSAPFSPLSSPQKFPVQWWCCIQRNLRLSSREMMGRTLYQNWEGMGCSCIFKYLYLNWSSDFLISHLYSFNYAIVSSIFMLGSLYLLHTKSSRQLLSTVGFPLGGTRSAQWKEPVPGADGLGVFRRGICWSSCITKRSLVWLQRSRAQGKSVGKEKEKNFRINMIS